MLGVVELVPLIVFGLYGGAASKAWWALGFLVIAGAAEMISGLFRSVMWNQTIPDEVRGRMAGVALLSYSIGPSFGQIRSSAVAQASSLRFSLVSGGIACVAACGLIAAAMPSLWRYDARTDPHAAARRADEPRSEAG